MVVLTPKLAARMLDLWPLWWYRECTSPGNRSLRPSLLDMALNPKLARPIDVELNPGRQYIVANGRVIYPNHGAS